MKVLVTGAAGFIGFHVALQLFARGDTVVGVDSMNDYYDPSLKQARIVAIADAARTASGAWTFLRTDLAEQGQVQTLFAAHTFDRVIHLAAQPGVRHSLTHPHDYVRNNVVAFTNMLEACRYSATPHLTYASTSSVYGANTKMPFSEVHGVDHPVQFYAATKRANELMAHAYSHLFQLPTTGLRFFTVYGPWGRPDMAPFIFARAIDEGRPIKVFNHGNHSRDFTYVGDIARGVILASDQVAAVDPQFDASAPDPGTSKAPFRIYNIGNSQPVKLADFIAAIEKALGKVAIKELLPLQPGDVPDTFADVSRLEAAVGYAPDTTVDRGVAAFIAWYRSYYGV
jgi:UDP-glucuronate 4-epimerase